MYQHLHLEELANRELVPGFDAKLVHGDGVTVAHVRIGKGAVLPEHHHPHEQVTNVIQGQLELIIDGEKHLCKGGDVVVIPGNVPHSGRGVTDCYVIDVFQPVREDYK